MARIATLNTRSILGSHKQTNSQLLCRHLRSKETAIDILCLQDISASHTNTTLINSDISKLQLFFEKSPAIWAKETAIISLNLQLSLENSCISKDGRCIITDVVHIPTSSTVCKLVNIYAPPNYQNRPDFYQQLMLLLTNPNIDIDEMLIVGDFNLHFYTSQPSKHYQPWVQWLTKQLYRCFERTRPKPDSHLFHRRQPYHH